MTEQETTIRDKAQEIIFRRALCPGCGAPLPLVERQAIVSCGYCGSPVKVERHSRVIEPVIEQVEPPDILGDPSRKYEDWGTTRLVAAILRDETPAEEKVLMARALDEWPHVNDEMASYVFTLARYMLTAPREVDEALAGILGKLICSDELSYRQVVISAGEHFGFSNPSSKGLVDALSLGDAGTVKLLLDIAQWASGSGDESYAAAALLAAQTAIGRESARSTVCMQILLYRYMYVAPQIQEWIARYLRCHFDVGYTELFCQTIELIDDCTRENPALVEPLIEALRLCRRAENEAEYRERIGIFGFLHSKKAKDAAGRTIGAPPPDVGGEVVKLAVDALSPLLEDRELEESAMEALRHLVWCGKEIPPSIAELYARKGESLHRHLKEAIESRME